MLKTTKIRSFEIGLRFREDEFVEGLRAGKHREFGLVNRTRVDVVSTRDTWLRHDQLDVIVKSGQLAADLRVLDLRDDQRALVWVDDRFEAIVGPGLHALWTAFSEVRVEVVDVTAPRLSHARLATILDNLTASAWLDSMLVPHGHVALLYLDGALDGALPAGRYAFWKGVADVRMAPIDLRERVLDVAGQEIMTADKVTLRLNAVVTYRVVDATRAVSAVDDHAKALYREAQLALRAVIGTRDLDQVLSDKNALATQLDETLHERAAAFGLRVLGIGIRDVILPGDMKELLNKVTEAKKAAEASVITRREETAAMRSQANTAKLLDASPTLMRLRELEAIERIAQTTNLSVVLGGESVADRVLKLV